MIDLTRLPKPSFFYQIDYEKELADLQKNYLSLNPSYENLLLDSDPVNKLIQLYAYQKILLKQEVNEKLRQCLLSDATGANLDNIAANSVTTRLPGESDESLRYRASIAPEGFTCAGPIGAYEYHALKVSKDIMHATILAHTPEQGYVMVLLLSHSNHGKASEELCDLVLDYLSAEEIRPLCDEVIVESARIKDINIKLKVTYFLGADENDVDARIIESLEYLSELNNSEKKAKDLFKPGEMLTLNQIHKAARVYGAQNIEIIEPKEDVISNKNEAIRIVTREVQHGGFYE